MAEAQVGHVAAQSEAPLDAPSVPEEAVTWGGVSGTRSADQPEDRSGIRSAEAPVVRPRWSDELELDPFLPAPAVDMFEHVDEDETLEPGTLSSPPSSTHPTPRVQPALSSLIVPADPVEAAEQILRVALGGSFPHLVARALAGDTVAYPKVESGPKVAMPPPATPAPVVQQQQIPFPVQVFPVAASAGATDSSATAPAQQETDRPTLPMLGDMIVPGKFMMTRVSRWGTTRPTSRQPLGPVRKKQTLQWQHIQPAVQPFGRDGVAIHIGDQAPRTERGADPSGIRSAGTARSSSGIPSAGERASSSGIRSARAATPSSASSLKPERLLSPFVNDQGQAFADCYFKNYHKWKLDNNLGTPAGYGEGFHREDFEDEQEPALAITNAHVRWVPIVSSFSSKETPIVVQNVDLWDPEWQSQINYKPHINRFYEFPRFASENKAGQLHNIPQPISIWFRHGSPHKRTSY